MYPQTSKQLQEYAGFCPSCGQRLVFAKPYRDIDCESVQARCSYVGPPFNGSGGCGKKWSMVFDLDESGTFGVMSFQCDNEDRVI